MFSHSFILHVNLCGHYRRDTERPHPRGPSCRPVMAKATSFPSPTLLPGDCSSVLISIIVSCQERHIDRLTQRVYPWRLVFFPLSMIPLGSSLVVWVPVVGASFHYRVEFQSIAMPPLFNHSPVRDLLVVPNLGLLQRNRPPTFT